MTSDPNPIPSHPIASGNLSRANKKRQTGHTANDDYTADAHKIGFLLHFPSFIPPVLLVTTLSEVMNFSRAHEYTRSSNYSDDANGLTNRVAQR